MNKTSKWIVLLIIIGLIPILAWGLHYFFSTPSMIYSQNRITIANCNPPRDENAKMVCQDLFCKKRIIESKKIHGKYSLIDVEDLGYSAVTGLSEILSGKIEYAEKPNTNAVMHYKCFMNGNDVKKFKLFAEEEWNRPILNSNNKIIRLMTGLICFSTQQKEKNLADLLESNNIKYLAGNNVSNKKEYCVSWRPSEDGKVENVFPAYKELKQACELSPNCNGRI